MTKDEVRDIFQPLSEGRPDKFFDRVADDVEWRVLGTHPLAGVYRSKQEFFDATFKRLGELFENGVTLRFRDCIVEGDSAAVELFSKDVSKSGMPFENEYCWVCHFKDGKIDQVRAYLDSALVRDMIDVGELKARRHQHPAAAFARGASRPS